jgi:hypothetical protein
VFIGTAGEAVREPLTDSRGWYVHTMTVNETLHGSIDSVVTLIPDSNPPPAALTRSSAVQTVWTSSCDYQFKAGRRYIVYARRTADGRWTTSRCSGTKPIEEAAHDLEYIASLPSANPAGDLSINVVRWVADPTDRINERVVPAERTPVMLTGPTQSLTARTDQEGRLNLQLPEGEYTVVPVAPQTIVVQGRQQVFLPARGCASASFSLVANGRIEGRVVREDGTGVANAPVAVLPVDAPEARPWEATGTRSARTDQTGAFAVERVLPGRYYVVVNGVSGPHWDAPFSRTYFPGVARKQESPIVELAEGERKSGFTTVVTPLLEKTLSGRVVAENGEGVADAGVTVRPAGRKARTVGTARTDSDGTFRVRVLAGTDYDVVVTRQMPRGGFQTAEIRISANQPTEDLQITIGR